ncbi:MAG TPA: purine-binding chemotaxis protein CheW [Spirochaetes bacterium]|nr:purine-binding chemotaxis protein CheW [Spirochaetota bacterium]
MSEAEKTKQEAAKPEARARDMARDVKADAAGEEQQYVTFIIGEETYGVEVLQVQEIIGMTAITHVPNSLSFMKGVINLRGMVVPVVDMRIKFSMAEKDYDAFTVIIIVEVMKRMVGMIVDSVSDVVSIPVKGIQDTPHFTAKIETDFIRGIGQVEEKLVIILDVDRILTAEEIRDMDNENKG